MENRVWFKIIIWTTLIAMLLSTLLMGVSVVMS
jgi:hypothetical protein